MKAGSRSKNERVIRDLTSVLGNSTPSREEIILDWIICVEGVGSGCIFRLAEIISGPGGYFCDGSCIDQENLRHALLVPLNAAQDPLPATQRFDSSQHRNTTARSTTAVRLQGETRKMTRFSVHGRSKKPAKWAVCTRIIAQNWKKSACPGILSPGKISKRDSFSRNPGLCNAR